MSRITRCSVALLGGLAMTAMTGSAWAAGFALMEQSVKGLGNVFAGSTATADDASTVFLNPAGMTRHEGAHLTGAMHIILPNAQFSNSTTTPSLTGAASALTGVADDGAVNAAVPNFYYTRQFSDQLWGGIGINSPFGLETDYSAGWIGRYHALKTRLLTLNINPSMAWKVNDRLSVGGGINLQYADAEITSALDIGTMAFGTAACAGAGAATCAAAGLAPGSDDGNVLIDVENSIAIGWNMGVLFEPIKGTRLGLAYRSAIEHDLEGNAVFTNTSSGLGKLSAVSAAAGAGLGALLSNDTVNADLDLPDTITAGFVHDVNDKLSIMGDVMWTNWSVADTVFVNFESSGGARVSSLVLDFEDSMRYAGGFEYAYDDDITLRGGMAWDETPVKTAATRTARIADNDRLWVGVGATLQANENLSFDIAYAHLFVDDTNIASTQTFDGTGALLSGTYDANVNIGSVQLNWTFE